MTTIRDRVLKILENYPETRNDDKLLYLEVLKGMGLIVRGSLGYLIKVEVIDKLISFESIRRRREEIQNEEHRFIPTDPAVLLARRFYRDTRAPHYDKCPREILEEEAQAYASEPLISSGLLDAVCDRCPHHHTDLCNAVGVPAGVHA